MPTFIYRDYTPLSGKYLAAALPHSRSARRHYVIGVPRRNHRQRMLGAGGGVARSNIVFFLPYFFGCGFMLPDTTDKHSTQPLGLGAEGERNDAPRAFDRFRNKVTQTPELLEQLRGAVNQETFIHNVVELGSVHGFLFSAAEVDLALSEARRGWLERNLP